ncbi:MAG: 16S rRNA (cytidine(1402)-2'-O)-methyltransferase [Pseudomonadota bacterium]|nr:16S rRNA (cytidine(1402)-2'-O)-methyltransferase [Pseudomonadota bacterium]
MKSTDSTGVLYMASTPIGNLEDVSDRFKTSIMSADAVICESPQHSMRLFSGLGVQPKRVRKLTDHQTPSQIAQLVDELMGSAITLYITDAGTPCISDPGHRLVAMAHERGVKVSVLPGPCAAVAALVMSGYDVMPFQFHGFLPVKPGPQRQLWLSIRHDPMVHVFYESPRRLLATLNCMADVYGFDQHIFIVKEMTKIHERYWRGCIRSVMGSLTDDLVRGEFVLVLPITEVKDSLEAVDPSTQSLMTALHVQSVPFRSALNVVLATTDMPKNTVYRWLSDIYGDKA